MRVTHSCFQELWRQRWLRLWLLIPTSNKVTVGAGESANGSLCLPWYNAPRYEFGFKFKLPHPDADILSFNFNLDFEDGVNNRRFRFVLDSNYGVDNTYQYFSSVGIMTDIPTFASLWRKQELWYQLRVVADFSVNTWKVIELNDLRLVGSALNTVGGGTLPYINISLVVDIAAITTVHFYLDRFYCYALR